MGCCLSKHRSNKGQSGPKRRRENDASQVIESIFPADDLGLIPTQEEIKMNSELDLELSRALGMVEELPLPEDDKKEKKTKASSSLLETFYSFHIPLIPLSILHMEEFQKVKHAVQTAGYSSFMKPILQQTLPPKPEAMRCSMMFEWIYMFFKLEGLFATVLALSHDADLPELSSQFPDVESFFKPLLSLSQSLDLSVLEDKRSLQMDRRRHQILSFRDVSDSPNYATFGVKSSILTGGETHDQWDNLKWYNLLQSNVACAYATSLIVMDASQTFVGSAFVWPSHVQAGVLAVECLDVAVWVKLAGKWHDVIGYVLLHSVVQYASKLGFKTMAIHAPCRWVASVLAEFGYEPSSNGNIWIRDHGRIIEQLYMKMHALKLKVNDLSSMFKSKLGWEHVKNDDLTKVFNKDDFPFNIQEILTQHDRLSVVVKRNPIYYLSNKKKRNMFNVPLQGVLEHLVSSDPAAKKLLSQYVQRLV